MAQNNRPSAAVIPLSALIVVIGASVAAGMWGAKGFVATCLVGSIVAGFLVTGGE